jgi:hypothetical protein
MVGIDRMDGRRRASGSRFTSTTLGRSKAMTPWAARQAARWVNSERRTTLIAKLPSSLSDSVFRPGDRDEKCSAPVGNRRLSAVA